MIPKILAITGLAVAFALPAAAQSSTSSTTTTNTPAETGQSSGMSIRQHIMQDLQKAGYKNIQLTPASFVAHATDSHGQPVLIAINPDSVTVISPAAGSGQSEPGKSASANAGNSPTAGGTKNGK
ncbi:hypothetical protein [Rhodopila sp.]|uniref:hypothetical protein n=1 Tax=Rhodopila sp. TaxID=2480087 RepID=UPI003D0D4A28